MRKPPLTLVICALLFSSICLADLVDTNGKMITLETSVPPAHNFDLKDWNISIPLDTNKDGKSDTVPEKFLAKGFFIKPYFYTGKDGGLVFRAYIDGAKTSKNTKFTRTELREMLREGNTRIKTQGVNENNWVFGGMRRAMRKKAGGVGGRLDATLAVNHVTTTGLKNQIGRVIVGQIHAKDDEPLRLYYRKLPKNELGSIYFAHEIRDGDDVYYEMIGSKASNAKNPEDGIALDEVFGYTVLVEGDMLTVTIKRDGKPDVTKSVDMTNSGYNKSNQYMYFKAGVYNQNNSGEKTDFVQATFYQIDNQH